MKLAWSGQPEACSARAAAISSRIFGASGRVHGVRLQTTTLVSLYWPNGPRSDNESPSKTRGGQVRSRQSKHTLGVAAASREERRRGGDILCDALDLANWNIPAVILSWDGVGKGW